MKLVHSITLALAIGVVGLPIRAAQPDPHQAHHPAGAASAPSPKVKSGKTGPDVAAMNTQMKAMGEMHDSMMAAKTPEERSALMAVHMKTMQEGMAMMNGMSSGGMGAMKSDPAARQQMMEKHMEMMQSMMQMMMDRLPAVPGK